MEDRFEWEGLQHSPGGTDVCSAGGRGAGGRGQKQETHRQRARQSFANWLDVRAELEAQVEGDSPVPSWVSGTEETSGKEG